MGKRAVILGGMGAGLAWGAAVIWLGPMWKDVDFLPALAVALLVAALPMVAMVGRLAQRRFFDDAIIDGQALSGAAEIDQRVLQNTAEQLVLAVCIWPLAGLVLGGGTLLTLGAGFALARVMFWLGYHLSPPLRGFGFAASFYPTVLAAVLALRDGLQILQG